LQNPLATHSRSVFGLANNQENKNVARKSKNEAGKQIDVPAPNPAAESAKTASRPVKKTRATAPKLKVRKTTAKEKTPKPADQSQSDKPATAPAVEPSDDAIRMRAYFLAERRARLSLPGDSAHDWIEARRQLLDEAGG
jgi:hypothetical protein